MRVRLAHDAGPGVGLGHQRRMEVLASALRERGAEATVAPLEGVVGGDVVVVDSYRVRADSDRITARRTVAVDDLDRDLAVDLVVEPAPACPPASPRRAPVLAGFAYALVDAGVARWRDRGIRDSVIEVLVATGGADVDGTGATIAARVRAALPGATVRRVGGDVLVTPAELHERLGNADVVVCSAGVTALEAVAAGRPVVVVMTAPNQLRTFDGLVAAGAVAGASVETAAGVVAALAGDPSRRRRLAATGAATVDGLGPGRVADAVIALA